MPNPSIERTCPGKPGHASHLKRWAARMEGTAMRDAAKQPASWSGQVLLALPSTEALVPSFSSPETFVAGLCSAHALSSWSVTSNAAPSVIAVNPFHQSRIASLCRFDAPLSVSLWVSRRGRPVPPEACYEPVCPEPTRRLKWLAQRGRTSSKQGVVPPNPSIERDVQGLAPLAAPHVKR